MPIIWTDMGLGKTFVGSEKMKELGEDLNVIVCQKSKIDDWYEHIKTFYPNYNVIKYAIFYTESLMQIYACITVNL